MPAAGMPMACRMLMPPVSMPAISMLPSKMSLRKIEPKPSGMNM